MNAMVIDDNRDSADTVVRMLQLVGVNARAYYGPRAAMTSLKDHYPDIVFLDINMPGVDGFEVLSYLRRFPAMANVSVVFITSDDQPETAERGREAGALTTIVKPITIESLEQAISQAHRVDTKE